ncbi:MAG: 7-cyano-7-deazaguanine synthase [Candidatus Krumholzibacteria bacterium]|nr:7-cyano-7-deazaguanine synthase [Candidatus Krumholzibacteria bacterium]
MKTENDSTAVFLLSGGLDSTVSVAIAAERGISGTAVFIDYSQKSSAREEAASRTVASHYGMGLDIVRLPWLGEMSSSGLVSGTVGGQIPDFPLSGDPGDEAAASKAVWVENRNGLFINVAAVFAASRGAAIIVTGFNREEAATYPDNSPDFIEASNRFLAISVGVSVRVEAPTIAMDKIQIVKEGLRLDIPWESVWSCYRDGDLMCGRCESCFRLKRAVAGSPAAGRLSWASR